MSPRQNRVTPTGEIVAIQLRGAWMGNRGILHDDAGRVVRHHASNLWITCALSFKGWRAEQWQPQRTRLAGIVDVRAWILGPGTVADSLGRRTAHRKGRQMTSRDTRGAFVRGRLYPPEPREHAE